MQIRSPSHARHISTGCAYREQKRTGVDVPYRCATDRVEKVIFLAALAFGTAVMNIMFPPGLVAKCVRTGDGNASTARRRAGRGGLPCAAHYLLTAITTVKSRRTVVRTWATRDPRQIDR